MNKRIFQKIYKRAEKKLLYYIKVYGDKRSTYELAMDPNVMLEPVERQVFLAEQERRILLMRDIKSELIRDGLW